MADTPRLAGRPRLNHSALVSAAVSTGSLILFEMLPDLLGHIGSAGAWVLLALAVAGGGVGHYIVSVRSDRRLDGEIAQWRRRLRQHTKPKTRPTSTQDAVSLR